MEGKYMNKNKKRAALNALLAMQRLSWEQGVTVQTCLECGEYELLAQLVKASVYRNVKDGRVAQVTYDDSITDACSVGEGLIYMTEHSEGEAHELYQDALQKLIIWALETAPRSENGVVYHLLTTKEYWVDSIYMLPPFLAAAGYYQEALKQVWGYIEALYNTKHGLMSHRWNVAENTFTNANFWGIGNGWTLTGIARLIDLLPEKMAEEKEKLIIFNRKLLNNILEYRTTTGWFHNVLNDADSFEEVNLSQMTAYTIYRGMRSGWLDNRYMNIADQLRNAALKEMDEDGYVHHVCGMPHFDHCGFAPEAQAFFVLMENEYERLS